MPAKIKIEDLPLEQIKQDFYNGLSILAISKKYHISRMTLRPILQNLGLVRLGRISKADVDSVMLNKQYHIGKIAKITGLDRTTVCKILKNNNIIPVKRDVKCKPVSISRYDQLKQTYTVVQITELLYKSVHHACIATGFSEQLIKRYASEYNITYTKAFRTYKDVSENDKLLILEKYTSNMFTMHDLEIMFNIGTKTLKTIVGNIPRNIIFNNKFEEYKKLVRRLTFVVKNLYNLNPGSGFHVDHKMSVYDGFYNNIPAYLIASFENLQIITSLDNLQKGSSSSITKDELYKLHGII